MVLTCAKLVGKRDFPLLSTFVSYLSMSFFKNCVANGYPNESKNDERVVLETFLKTPVGKVCFKSQYQKN